MRKVLLLNPPYFYQIFSSSIVKAMVSQGIMPLGLACLAGSLKEASIQVDILDLNLVKDFQAALASEINSFKPDIVGITFTTPLFDIAKFLASSVKKLNPKISTVCGGPHVSILPEETLKNSEFDIAILREGDYSFRRLASGEPLDAIDGLAYKDNGSVMIRQPVSYIEDLDRLPFAALDLFDAAKYRYPKVTAKKNPVASLETSRGCFSRCTYCNKSIFGYRFRPKGVNRVVDEMRFILNLGYKEIHIIDDGFTTDMERASKICREMKKRGLNFPWYVRGGLRVDRVSKGLLKEMRDSGCYRVPYGIESGDEEVLDGIKKGITLRQVEDAVKWAKELGMIVDGYFMLGLPYETVESIERTIEFSRKLNLDYAKFAITVPLPGTPIFEDLKRKGMLLTEDWSKYHFATSPREIYRHEQVGWGDLEKYYKLAHRKFYLRPGYILKRFMSGIINGELAAYIKAFFDFQQTTHN